MHIQFTTLKGATVALPVDSMALWKGMSTVSGKTFERFFVWPVYSNETSYEVDSDEYGALLGILGESTGLLRTPGRVSK